METQPLFASLPERGYVGLGASLNGRAGTLPGFDTAIDGGFVDSYLRFPTGSFVLFGPNGVGKSRVLCAFAESLGKPGEREHTTRLFVTEPEGALAKDRIAHYLQTRASRRQNHEEIQNLPQDLSKAIAADGHITVIRVPGSSSPTEAVCISQDSGQERVRRAVATLMEQLTSARENPAQIVDLYTIGFPAFLKATDPQRLDAYKNGAEDDDLEWLKSPAGKAAMSALTDREWLDYLENCPPDEVLDSDELLVFGAESFGRFVEKERPSWAPWPLESVPDGTLMPSANAHLSLDDDLWDSRSGPRGVLADVDEMTIDPSVLLKGLPVSQLQAVGGEIAALATDFLQRLLLRPPSIDFEGVNTGTTVTEPRVVGRLSWQIYDPWHGMQGPSVDRFSATQQRWITAAINLAALIVFEQENPNRRRTAVVTCDEPELGLPMQGQKHLSRGLSSIAQDFGITFALASHSPAILADENFSLVRVGRTSSMIRSLNGEIRLVDDVVALELIDEGERQRLVKVGVAPSEMLHLYQTILLVEGLHDLWVLDELVGPELENLRVKVFPVHGAKQAASLFASEAGLIFDHVPDANFVVAVDGTRQDLLAAMLSAAHADGLASERLSELDRIVSDGDPSDEAKVMHALLRKAIESDRLERLGGLFGFLERDIIEYLEPAAFGLESSWTELRTQHLELLETKKGTAKDFKRWLGIKYSVSFDEPTVRSAVPQDSIPDEVLTLLELCRSASATN